MPAVPFIHGTEENKNNEKSRNDENTNLFVAESATLKEEGMHMVEDVNVREDIPPPMVDTIDSSYTLQQATDVAEREVLLASDTILATDSPWFTTYKLSDITDHPHLRHAFGLYSHFSYKTICFRLTWVATPFEYGRAFVAEVPKAHQIAVPNRVAPWGVPHAISSVAGAESVCFERNWVSQYDFTPCHGDDHLVVWTVGQYHKLRSTANDVAKATLMVYVRLSGVKFHQPQLEFQSGGRKRKAKRVKRSKKQDTSEQDVRSEKGVVTQIAETTSTLANTFSTFPVVGQYASMVGNVADIAGSIASAFGLQKPVSGMASYQSVSSSVPIDVANPRGMASIQRFALGVDSSASADPTIFGDDVDYMDLSELSQIPGVLKPSIILSGDTGDVVLRTAVHPAVNGDLIGGNQRWANFVETLAYLHQWWRGSLDYTFIVSAPATATVRLGFAILPFDQRESVTSADWIGSVPTYEVSIMGDTEFTLRVPYVHTSRRQRTSDTKGPYLVCWQLSPVQNAGFIGDVPLEMTVLVAGGDDTQWWAPVEQSTAALHLGVSSGLQFQYNPRTDRKPLQFPMTQIVVPTDTECGETATHWKDHVLTPRFYTLPATEPSESVYLRCCIPAFKRVNSTGYVATWRRGPFAFYRTGGRYYGIRPDALADALIGVAPVLGSHDDHAGVVALTDTNMLNVEMPYDRAERFQTAFIDLKNSPILGRRIPVKPKPTPYGQGYVWSASDDFVAGFPMVTYIDHLPTPLTVAETERAPPTVESVDVPRW